MRKNPITEEVLQSEEEFIQSIIDSYTKILIARHNLDQDEKEIIDVFHQLTGDEKGSITFKGVEDSIRVKNRFYESYPKERNEEHPLAILMERYPIEMEEFVSVSYKERFAKVEKLLADYRNDRLTGSKKKIADLMFKRRVVKQGKPEIEVKGGKGNG